MKKGLSPFLATIFLMAITVAVLGLIGPQLISFIRDQAETTTDRAARDIDCSNAGLNVHDYEINMSENYIEFRIENTGYEELSDFRADLFFTDRTSQTISFQESDIILPGGESMYLMNDTYDAGGAEEIDIVIVISETCPSEARSEVSIA